MSADGRFVAFASSASNLVVPDSNFISDVYVRDVQSGTIERIDLNSEGIQANNSNDYPSISGDGRYVAFESTATNLIPVDANGNIQDIFVRDRLTGTTEIVSISSLGGQGDFASRRPFISSDGRYVAFESDATNLVPGDTNGWTDVFLRDRLNGTTELVSVSSSGTQGSSGSYAPSISTDEHVIVFWSFAPNLVLNDTNGSHDIFVRDLVAGTTELVSRNSAGQQGNSDSFWGSASSDGRYVAFDSVADNLIPNDANDTFDVFVRDRLTGQTEIVSVSTGGIQSNSDSRRPSISDDGSFVAFSSIGDTLVSGDVNGAYDTFLRNRQAGTTELISLSSIGEHGNSHSGFFLSSPSISRDARYVAFYSDASNLVLDDSNASTDVFLRDRHANGFTSLCESGVDGVISCPCSNPPSGAGRGCDNSSATGGATLEASGIAYLSIDSLVLTTSGEKPTALSIVMQGNAVIHGGIVYGQGIRCLGGTIIRRLFIKHAVGGSITAPDLAVGDPTISARSAAKGDLIQPSGSRYYLVYYRDPIVLGGCPASSTFNATQTGRVDWSL